MRLENDNWLSPSQTSKADEALQSWISQLNTGPVIRSIVGQTVASNVI